MTAEDRCRASQTICEQVIRMPAFRKSRRIACYLPTPYEVDTWPIIARGWRMQKRIFAPVTSADGRIVYRELVPSTNLVAADFGILEPVDGEILPARKFDMVIVPMVAFDADHNRIGMGGGYHDRTFAFLRHRRLYCRPKLVGVAFDCQKVEKIPVNPWDIRVFCVVTEASQTP